jgi:hypothetical protein
VVRFRTIKHDVMLASFCSQYNMTFLFRIPTSLSAAGPNQECNLYYHIVRICEEIVFYNSSKESNFKFKFHSLDKRIRTFCVSVVRRYGMYLLLCLCSSKQSIPSPRFAVGLTPSVKASHFVEYYVIDSSSIEVYCRPITHYIVCITVIP